jgi:hypothetical protein
MKAEDAKSAAFAILDSMDETRGLELIRLATNRLYLEMRIDDHHSTLEWRDDLNLEDKHGLVAMMNAQARLLAARDQSQFRS